MSFWCADWIGPTLSPGQQVMASQPPLASAASAKARSAISLAME